MRLVALFFAASLVACKPAPMPSDFGVTDAGAGAAQDAFAYQSCDTICLRPSDCAIAYNNDGVCPPNFRCARTFSCSDGGMP